MNMSETDAITRSEKNEKRGLDDSDHDSDAESRRHKRAAVPDSTSAVSDRPLNKRRTSEDSKYHAFWNIPHYCLLLLCRAVAKS